VPLSPVACQTARRIRRDIQMIDASALRLE
jgi:hypothetical protein